MFFLHLSLLLTLSPKGASQTLEEYRKDVEVLKDKGCGIKQPGFNPGRGLSAVQSSRPTLTVRWWHNV